MKTKIKNWIKRYLPAEILGTFGAIVFPTIASFFTDNILVIALVATWGENLGFYGIMIFQEVKESKVKHQKMQKAYGITSFGKSMRNIFLEFGVAETIDSLFVRPAIMFFSVSTFQNLQLAIFVGKIIADVIFYIPAIISYELRKKHLID
jgi:hypothetical protein